MPKVPYWYQAEAVASVWDYYGNGGKGNSIIALPTGTGKSFVLAELVKQIMFAYPNERLLGLTHVKDLISQNMDELLEHWPTAPAGICSAGLSQKDTNLPIIYGGIQTVVNQVERIGHRDLIFIDECHLVGPRAESRYQQVLGQLTAINPKLKVIGMSATCFRLGQGHLTEGGIFQDVIYDMTSYEGFNRLLAEGFMVPPVAPTRDRHGKQLTQYDLSNVHSDGYKFNERELDAASNQEGLNYKVCEEMCDMAQDRQSWLVACASIDHVEKITAILRQFGIDADCVHSDWKIHKKHGRNKGHNTDRKAKWKSGALRVLVSKEMLTTGINNPRCDYIGCLRGLVSSALWVQLLGRGTRPYILGNKSNCLVGDFAGNTKRLGPINDPVLPRKPGKGKPGTVPIKICDSCGCYNHARATICDGCGAVFPISSRLVEYASEVELVRTTEPIIQTHEVHHVIYYPHVKADKPMCMKVAYHVGNQGLQKFDEWIHIEGKSLAHKKAIDWWRLRTNTALPPSTELALEYARMLRIPRFIRVQTNSKYPEIVGVEF